MILPLFPFLMIDVPDMSPTDSAPIVFQVPDPDTGKTLDRFEICIDTIEHVEIGRADGWGRPVLNVMLNKAGSQRLADLSTRYVGHETELALDGRVIVRPRILEPLLGGGLQITGVDTIAEAEQLLKAARGQCTLPKAKNE